MKALVRFAMTALLLPLLALAACAQDPGTPPSNRIDLTVTLTESPDAEPSEFRLLANGSTPDPASTLPDPAAALAAVLLDDGKILFPVPDPSRICTEQYGGPQIATVTGWYKGRAVNTSFKRTDGCEIARWQGAAGLLDGLGGSSGAI